MANNRNFQLGESLAFNVFYKNTGPNSVELIDAGRWLYIEADTDSKTEDAAIAEFRKRVSREEQTIRSRPSTLMPMEERWFSAYAFSSEKEEWKVTQDDLDKLRDGKEFALLLSLITYKDNGVTHHLRRCAWLQPPALPPGIWHFCEGFNKSD